MALEEKVRIDKWLWAARFFKTRSLASRAVSGGHVHVHGQRVKPSRPVQIDDELLFKRGLTEGAVVVLDISDRRGPATVARALYRETEQSVKLRELSVQQRRLEKADGPGPSRRPDKRDRRKIRKFTRKD